MTRSAPPERTSRPSSRLRAAAVVAVLAVGLGVGLLAPVGSAADAVLAVLLAALLAVHARWPFGPAPIVALALLAGAHFLGPSLGRWALAGDVQTWNLFHYTVAPRFFGELGYHDLYLGALAADRAGDDRLQQVRQVRDLHTYVRRPRHALEPTYRLDEHFSPARAEELRGAVYALLPTQSPEEWRHVFLDRGYNGSPPYTAIAAVTAAALPAERPALLRVATAIDLALLAAGLLALLAAWGIEATATAALLLLLFPGTEGRLVGGFLEYDWLAALMVGAAALRAERPIPAAFALSWATASRLFPGALVVSALLPAARRWIRGEPVARFDRTFAVAVAGFGFGWLLLGCFTARGPAAWLEWVPRILHHASEHVAGERRLGLQHLLTWAPGPSDDAVRAAVVAARAPLCWALVALGLAGWAHAASRRSRPEALQLGWVPVYLLAASSRYYWAGAALAALIPIARGRWVAAALGLVFAVGHVARWAGADRYTQYVCIGAALAAALTGWVLFRPSPEGGADRATCA